MKAKVCVPGIGNHGRGIEEVSNAIRTSKPTRLGKAGLAAWRTYEDYDLQVGNPTGRYVTRNGLITAIRTSLLMLVFRLPLGHGLIVNRTLKTPCMPCAGIFARFQGLLGLGVDDHLGWAALYLWRHAP